jgi:2-keto-4-pentenoate hydratase
MPLACIRPAPTRLARCGNAPIRLIAEICFRLGRSLPDYDAPYTRDQVRAAIESVHPAVAVLRPRPADAAPSDPLTAIGSGCGHRLLIHGNPVPGWRQGDISGAVVNVLQAGKPTLSQGVDWTDDPIGLLQWLANQGARWVGRLTVGQWVAIGLGGREFQVHTNQPAHIVVGTLGGIDLHFV